MSTTLFHRVVRTLVFDDGATVCAIGPGGAVLRHTNGQRTIYVFAYRDDEADLVERMRASAEANGESAGDLVLVGGPTDAWSLLTDARPRASGLQLHHVDADGGLRQSRRSFRGASLPSLATLRPLDAANDAAFAARVEADIARFGNEMADVERFGAAISARRPIATAILVGACVLIFVLQSVFTDRNMVASYLRMGALSSDAVFAGEWWRLFSATLLHGDIQHLLFNMFVLWSLGSFLERLVGSTRFLVLYGASALAGSLASVMFLDPGRFSVGASGALWGILAAGGVLAYLRQGPLPDAMIPQARRAALINLGLNTFVSFMPNIDIAAHFGGGLAGALITWTGVLTLGLQTRAPTARVAPAPRWISATAIGLTLALVGSFGVAMAIGQPWTLKAEVTYTQVELPALRTAIDAPDGLPQRLAEAPNSPPVVVFGDIRRDGVAIDLIAFDLPAALPREAAIAEMKSALEKHLPVPGATRLSGPTLTTAGDRWAVEAHYTVAKGARVSRALRVEGDRAWRVDVGYSANDNRWSTAARAMVLSARTLK